MNFLSTDSEMSELEFVDLNANISQQGGADNDEDSINKKKWEADFEYIFNKAKNVAQGETQSKPLVGGYTDDKISQIAFEMFGGANPDMIKVSQIAILLRTMNMPKSVNPIGVAWLIWNEAKEKVDNQKDIEKIAQIANNYAKNPDRFIDKYSRMTKAATIIMDNVKPKGVTKMEVAKVLWKDAIHESNSGASNVDIEKKAISLANENPEKYVTMVKKNKKNAKK